MPSYIIIIIIKRFLHLYVYVFGIVSDAKHTATEPNIIRRLLFGAGHRTIIIDCSAATCSRMEIIHFRLNAIRVQTKRHEYTFSVVDSNLHVAYVYT